MLVLEESIIWNDFGTKGFRLVCVYMEKEEEEKEREGRKRECAREKFGDANKKINKFKAQVSIFSIINMRRHIKLGEIIVVAKANDV